MLKRFLPGRPGWLYTAAIIVAIGPATLSAQWLGYATPGVPHTPDGKPNMEAPAPRTADGKPDLSGMWGWVNIGKPCGAECGDTQISREFINIASTLKGGLPYQPWAAALVKKRSIEQGLDPNVHCMPRDAPRIWTDDYYKRIFEVPGRIVILMERNMQYRQIFTDGRAFPKDPNPTWNGYSTGHWEGDTMVIETIGFRDDLWLDAAGNPLTEQGKNPAAQLRDPRSRDHDQRSEGLHGAVDRDDQTAIGSRQRVDRLLLPRE
jgi:hypothetical protein